MTTLEDYWPPYAVRIIEGDLGLTVLREADCAELIDLVLDGVHAPELMPFSMPWTDAPPEQLPANYLRYVGQTLAEFTPEQFTVNFVVRRAGEVVGVQGVSCKDFAVTRTGETGSWLGRRFHEQGIGTRMRRALCAFLFDHLGATQITSSAFVDNPASLAVSRKVGYRPNGIVRMERRGVCAENQHLVLRPEDFVRGEPIAVTGAEALRRFVGVA